MRGPAMTITGRPLRCETACCILVPVYVDGYIIYLSDRGSLMAGNQSNRALPGKSAV